MDMYVRNVKIIEDAFDQIKEQTGISSNEEIVTTFCKSEEQNNSLINYINNLNSEIDVIGELNKNIESEIKRHEELGQLSEKEKRGLKQKLRQEIADIKHNTATKDAQIKEVENQMVEIKEYVQTMVTTFQDSEFQLAVTSPQVYHEDVQFNENNVTLYLSELEEFISTFITFLAQRNKTSYPSIQALPLDTIGIKDFSKGHVQIDTSMPAEYAHIVEEADTEDEYVTNPRDLFKKFNDIAAKDFGALNGQGGQQQAPARR